MFLPIPFRRLSFSSMLLAMVEVVKYKMYMAYGEGKKCFLLPAISHSSKKKWKKKKSFLIRNEKVDLIPLSLFSANYPCCVEIYIK